MILRGDVFLWPPARGVGVGGRLEPKERSLVLAVDDPCPTDDGWHSVSCVFLDECSPTTVWHHPGDGVEIWFRSES